MNSISGKIPESEVPEFVGQVADGEAGVADGGQRIEVFLSRQSVRH